MLDTKSASVSVVVPTFRERDNLEELITRLKAVRSAHFKEMELLIVDDDSKDGSEEVIRRMNEAWVKFITRKHPPRSLSLAVMDGLKLASNDYFVVMDADLSHSPESVPSLVAPLLQGTSDFVVGSRYVSGGEIAQDWPFFRELNSKFASSLARAFFPIRDPLSGFFALPRAVWNRSAPLDPVGYKIGLELAVKGHCKKISEVPIHFEDRKHGKSKFGLREIWNYLKHLRKLADFHYGRSPSILQWLRLVLGLRASTR